MLGAYVMTQHNCEGHAVVNDTIGLAAYTMDSHNCRRLVVNGMVKNEGNVEIGGFGPYPISYRSIIPQPKECTNLLVPVCLSASHISYGSIRIEPVFMVLVQSAAVAACMAIDNQQKVHQVDIRKLQALLKTNPLMDGSVPDVLVDNDDSARVKVSGKWKRFTSEPQRGYTGNYGPSMLVAGPGICGQNKVKFIPHVLVAGQYHLYYYVPRIPNASPKTKIEINTAAGAKNVWIRTAGMVVEGQTSGEWADLGCYTLPKGKKVVVTVSDDGAEGAVVADALLLVHVK
jgi:hypothetical protein